MRNLTKSAVAQDSEYINQLHHNLGIGIEPLPRPDSGYFTISQIIDGDWKQKAYKMSQLEDVLKSLDKDVDTYISQSVFKRPNRRSENLHTMSHAFVDLDTYNVEALKGMAVENIVDKILTFCKKNQIPIPSLIISSGRGLYLKYIWSTFVSGQARERAVAVNKQLVETFREFGTDPHCVDMSRIFRVVGSVNSKSGTRCSLAWAEPGEDGKLVKTYDFEKFADEILPYTREEVKAFRESKNKLASLGQFKRQKKPGLKKGGWRQFHWKVLDDIVHLKMMRYGSGTVQKPMRDTFGFLGAVQLAHVIDSKANLFDEIRCWISQSGLLRESYTSKELISACSTLNNRLKEQRAGKSRILNGKKISPVYTYSIKRMIKLLDIKQHEMKQLTVLIDAKEKQRRDTVRKRKKRRDAGMIPREKYLSRAADRKKKARTLKAAGKSISEISQAIGVKRSTVYGYL
jgi:hypothetical protein